MIAVVGASGFVGKALISRLPHQQVVGVSRSGGVSHDGVEHRAADALQYEQLLKALKGCSSAVYLVHSMLKPPQGTHARFQDLDLLAADSFRRAAEECGIRRVVYVGGLIDQSSKKLSRHLGSRLEVEKALRSTHYRLVAIRSGLVVGAGGSSYEIMTDLVHRLPLMLCPRWMSTRTTPIALDDLVSLIEHALTCSVSDHQTWDVGGGETLSYKQMMIQVAHSMGKRPLMISVPVFSPRLSRLWVQLITQKPRELVYPLVESLKTPMLADPKIFQDKIGRTPMSFGESLAKARQATIQPKTHSRTGSSSRSSRSLSVQRLFLPPHLSAPLNAPKMAAAYFAWARRRFWPWIRVEVHTRGGVDFRLLGFSFPLISIRPRRGHFSEERVGYWVRGGALIGKGRPLGHFEFRIVKQTQAGLSILRDYRTALPRWLYENTQALLHVWVMRAFSRWLERSYRAGVPDLLPEHDPRSVRDTLAERE